MKTFDIQIRVDANYLQVECSPNTPFMFVGEIKDLSRAYFDDIINQEDKK
jgi:hypothetical protein